MAPAMFMSPAKLGITRLRLPPLDPSSSVFNPKLQPLVKCSSVQAADRYCRLPDNKSSESCSSPTRERQLQMPEQLAAKARRGESKSGTPLGKNATPRSGRSWYQHKRCQQPDHQCSAKSAVSRIHPDRWTERTGNDPICLHTHHHHYWLREESASRAGRPRLRQETRRIKRDCAPDGDISQRSEHRSGSIATASPTITHVLDEDTQLRLFGPASFPGPGAVKCLAEYGELRSRSSVSDNNRRGCGGDPHARQRASVTWSTRRYYVGAEGGSHTRPREMSPGMCTRRFNNNGRCGSR